MTADTSAIWAEMAAACGATTPAGGDACTSSPAEPYPSVEDAAWRGHSHGSERKCDTTCWSERVDIVANGSALCPSCRAVGTHLVDCPTVRPFQFVAAADAWSEPTIWSADPERPAQLLARHQLPRTAEGDALWHLIAAAVTDAADLHAAGSTVRGWSS